MKRKRMTAIIALVLAVLMVVTLMASLIPMSASAINQSDIDDLQNQKNEISGRVQDAKARVEALKAEQANVLEQKAALDAQSKAAQEQLELVAQEIAMYDGMIEQKAQELEEARTREENQRLRYRARVRAMEENGGYNILALLAGADSFGELLTAIDDMGEIMESDKRLEKEYADAREETEEVKAEYEQVREEYGEKQDALRIEQAEIEQDIKEAQARLEELDEDIQWAIQVYEAAEAEEAAAASTILAMIQQYNEQKRQEEANNPSNGGNGGGDNGGGDNGGNGGSGGGNGSSGGGLNPGGATGTGTFIWPVPCSTRVTSRFGYRIDPFTNKERYHSGIDIDGFGNAGNSIVAADGGQVITAAYDPGGYGNYVIIDHGNSTQTLYAHMSGMAVSQWDWVEQGQVIGYLGETGRATGVHCHFEVFVNGGRTDPAAYFSGLTYWNC